MPQIKKLQDDIKDLREAIADSEDVLKELSPSDKKYIDYSKGLDEDKAELAKLESELKAAQAAAKPAPKPEPKPKPAPKPKPEPYYSPKYSALNEKIADAEREVNAHAQRVKMYTEFNDDPDELERNQEALEYWEVELENLTKLKQEELDKTQNSEQSKSKPAQAAAKPAPKPAKSDTNEPYYSPKYKELWKKEQEVNRTINKLADELEMYKASEDEEADLVEITERKLKTAEQESERLLELMKKELDSTQKGASKPQPAKTKPEPKPEPKTEPAKPKGARIVTDKMMWNTPTTLEKLAQYGVLYELEVVEGTCQKVAVLLKEPQEVFAYGNKKETPTRAQKGDLVEFVHVDKDKTNGKDLYQQFNIIGNASDKCIRKHEIKVDANGKVTKKDIESPTVKEAIAKDKEQTEQTPVLQKMPQIAKKISKADAELLDSIEMTPEEWKAIETMADGLEGANAVKLQTVQNVAKKVKGVDEFGFTKTELDAIAKASEKAFLALKKEQHAANRNHSEQYTNDGLTMNAVAKVLALDVQHAEHGNEDEVITALWRRDHDNRVIFEYREKTKNGSFSEPVYKLLQEKKLRLLETSAPKDEDVLVDIRQSLLEASGKTPTSKIRFLDAIYNAKGKPAKGRIASCYELQAQLHKCRSNNGNCTKEQKAELNRKAEKCSEISKLVVSYNEIVAEYYNVLQFKGKKLYTKINEASDKGKIAVQD